MVFENIFSQSVACLLTVLTLSFEGQKFETLMEPSLSIISFMDCAFGVLSKKVSPYLRLLGFFHCYLLGVLRFCILHLVYNPFWVIFMNGIKSVSRFFFFFFFFVCGCPCSSTICWKDYLCPLYRLFSFVKDQLTKYMWFYFGFSIMF